MVPVEELAEALGIEPGHAARLTKEAYGLVAAPLCWFKKVCAVMESIGFRRILSDPCCWTLLTDESDEEFIKRCGGNVEDHPEFTDPKAAAE